MQIRIQYLAQLKQAAGQAEELLDLCPQPLTLRRLAAQLAADRPALQAYFPTNDDRPAAVLAFVNGRQRSWFDETPLAAGDDVTFLSPMAGG